MSRAVAISLCLALAFASTLAASDVVGVIQTSKGPREIRALPPDAAPLLLSRIAEAAAARRSGPQALAVAQETSLPSFLFAAAGSLQGGGGTFFRSDVTLVNWDSVPQHIAVIFAPRDRTGVGGTPFVITMQPDEILTITDFVAAINRSGQLGALVVVPVDSAGNNDPVASVDGFSRIYSNQPGLSSGSVSQPFPAVSTGGYVGFRQAWAFGLRHEAAFRTNAGVVNLDTFAHTWTVNVVGDRGNAQFEVTVQPLSMVQVAIPAGDYGSVELAFTLQGSNTNFGWAAYGSTVDNATGDSWSSIASVPLDPSAFEK